MKIEVLKEYIRQTVRKELKSELKSVLKEEIKHCLSEAFVSNATVASIKSEDERHDSKYLESPKVKTPVKKEYKRYTSNPVLNDILNETTGGVPQEGSYAGLMGSLSSTGDEPDILEESVKTVTADDVPNATPAQKAVLNQINRNYSDVLKASYRTNR